MKVLFDVIKGPCLTEKSNLLQEVHNTVVFKVNPKANKIEIKNAVEDLFDVKVQSVKTAMVHGKKRRVTGKKRILPCPKVKSISLTNCKRQLDNTENTGIYVTIYQG